MSALVGFPLEDLEEMRDAIAKDLDNGEAAIEEKSAAGEDHTEYLEFWNQLLTDYELVVEAIRRML